MMAWTKKHFRRMMKDLVIAADQILFNYQNSRAARRLETQGTEKQEKSEVELPAPARGGKTA
jgi:hypothetical protein